MTRSRDLANLADSTEFTSADNTKLDGIETSATADQTNAEIRSAVEAATDSNVFTDADHTKLNAIEASATADQTDAEIKTAVEAATNIALGGSPTTTTQAESDDSTKIATTAYVTDKITTLIGGAPSTLNDLNELAAAINDDANYNSTLTTALATKLPLAGGTVTGNVSFGDNNKAIFGTGSDLQIYHSGSHSLIEETGTGALKLKGEDIRLEDADGNNIIKATSTAAELYFSGAKKLETTEYGVAATGQLVATTTAHNAGSTLNSTGTTQLWLRDTDASSNQKNWGFQVSGGDLNIVRANDDRASGFVTPVYIQQAPANSLVINSSGNVGIGTSSPVSLSGQTSLTINGTSVGRLDLQGTGQLYANSTEIVLQGAYGKPVAIDAGTNQHISFRYATAEKMRLDSSGRLLLGTTSTYFADADDLVVAGSGNQGITIVSGTSNTGNIFFADGTSGDDRYRGIVRYDHSDNAMKFYTNGANERMRINSSGHLLIGKTADDNTTVGTAIHDNGFMSIARSGNIAMLLERSASSGDILRFTSGGATVGSVQSRSGAVSTLILDPRANGVGLAASTNQLFPSNGSGSIGIASATVDLGGGSSYPFRDLYLSGGIQFDARSNKLEDYEEGTWTVALSGTSTTVINETGYYTKIGNQVFFSLYTGACNLTSSSGNALVTGLPYTVKSGAGNYSAVSIAHNSMFGGSATVGQQAYVLVGTTTVIFNNVGTPSNPSFVDGNTKYLMMAGVYLTN